MSPESLQLKKEFEIQKIASLHYFEYKSDFIFKSEYHDYWKYFMSKMEALKLHFLIKSFLQ